MKISELNNYLKSKTLHFSDKVASNPTVKFIQRKENQFVLGIDALPKPLMLTLHAIPLVNIAAHYFKEKGLKARLPQYEALINANLRFAPLNQEVSNLYNQKKAYKNAIKSMSDARAELAAKPPARDLKEKASRKITSWQCSDSKIREATAAQEKVQKQIDQLAPKHRKAIIDKTTAQANLNAVNTNGEAAAIDKERKHLKYAYRAGLGILTAVAVTAIALSAFALIPMVVGLGFGFALGASLGIHIAMAKSNKWKHQGDTILTSKD